MEHDHADATALMIRATAGDRDAAAALLPLVYAQLRGAANLALSRERPDHTLQPTALVHEAYLRLVGTRRVPWTGRAHFYAAAAQAMRRILTDWARARAARPDLDRRASSGTAMEIPDAAALALREPEEILAVDAAITRLEAEDPEAATLVRLRFFAGLSVDDAAAAMGVSPRTAARLWTYARAVLHRELAGSEGKGRSSQT